MVWVYSENYSTKNSYQNNGGRQTKDKARRKTKKTMNRNKGKSLEDMKILARVMEKKGGRGHGSQSG